jgi:hypothetical protein
MSSYLQMLNFSLDSNCVLWPASSLVCYTVEGINTSINETLLYTAKGVIPCIMFSVRHVKVKVKQSRYTPWRRLGGKEI